MVFSVRDNLKLLWVWLEVSLDSLCQYNGCTAVIFFCGSSGRLISAIFFFLMVFEAFDCFEAARVYFGGRILWAVLKMKFA